MKTLKDAAVGQRVKISRINGNGALQRRIMDLGLLRGVELLVRKVAPLGDPLEITIRGYELTLRKQEADFVIMEVK